MFGYVLSSESLLTLMQNIYHKLFIKRYDSFTLSMLLTQLKYRPTQEQISYAILYKEGRDLLLSNSLSLARMKAFEKQIKASNNEDDLKWLILWMSGELNSQEQKFVQSILWR